MILVKTKFSKHFIYFSFVLLSYSSFSQTRYIDVLFNGINETKNVVYSENVPQPLGSPEIISVLGTLPQNTNVPEHITTSVSLTMDVFSATGDTSTDKAVVLIMPGGGFNTLNNEAGDLRSLATAYAKRGFVAAILNYRIGINIFNKEAAQRAVYRATQDLHTAIRYLRKDAVTSNTFGIDPDKIFAIGISAGGFAALHNAYLDLETERPESSKAISYIYSEIPFQDQKNYNIPDLGCLDCVGGSVDEDGKANAAIAFAGALGDLDFISGSYDIPVQLFHSSDDTSVPFDTGVPFNGVSGDLDSVFGSNAIKQDADSKGAYVELNAYTDRGHQVHTTDGTALYSDIIPKTTTFLAQEIEKIDSNQPLNTLVFEKNTVYSVYPNPVQKGQELTIQIPNNEASITLTIQTLLGVTIFKNTYHNAANFLRLDAADLNLAGNNGIVLFTIETGKDRLVKKIAVN